MSVTKNTARSRNGFATEKMTPNTTMPATSVESARTDVMNIPPIAMPPRSAIRFIGAIM